VLQCCDLLTLLFSGDFGLFLFEVLGKGFLIRSQNAEQLPEGQEEVSYAHMKKVKWHCLSVSSMSKS